MSMYEFGLGEFRLQNGWKAWINSIIPEPCDTIFTRYGYYWDENDEVYQIGAWTKYGEIMNSMTNNHLSLTPPRRERWLIEYEGESLGTTAYRTPKQADQQLEVYDNSKLVQFVELHPGEKIVKE